MKHYSIRVTGKVQGVYFRANTHDVAVKLKLNGYVMNKADGSVHIEAEGDESALQQLVEWCHKGPGRARVELVTLEEKPVVGLNGFTVKR